MQDQGKRLLLATALALGVFAVYSMVAPEDEPPRPTSGQTAGADQAAASTQAVATVPQIGPPGGSPATEATVQPPGPPIQLTTDHFVATFSSECGGLTSWQLTDKRYENDATRGDLLPDRARMTVGETGGKPVAEPATRFASLPACGAFDVNFVSKTSTYFVPRDAVWKGEKLSPTEVRYTYASDQLEIVKDFTVVPESYLVRMVVKVNVKLPEGREARQQLAVSVYGYQDPAALEEGSQYVAARVWASSTLRDDAIVSTNVDKVIEWPRFERSIQWTGFEQPYLLNVYAPAGGEEVEKHTSASDGTKGRPRGFMQTDVLFPVATLKHGDASFSKTVVGYLGPKNYDDLQEADAAAGFATGFDRTVDLGWFAFIGRPLLWLLQEFQKVVGNWGIAIVLLTILVKLATLYWTTKSMRSMKQMAVLAPQMKALQTKYADDKQRQQAETMALYKQHGVNPLAGCLPMLLQMPIWFALYRMLSSAGELYQQPLIPGWIDDLTATDPYWVLPGVLFATMFLQARLQPASVDSRQQKFMQYGLPILFGGMSMFFPAGLTLYMLTNNVLSALHSIYMNKFDKKSLGLTAQLKKNQEETAATEAAKSGKPSAKNHGVPVAKRMIDARATEVLAEGRAGEDRASDGEASEDAPSAAQATPGAGGARNRPRRKKRRR